VNKQLENVQKLCFDDMFGYDAALKADEQASAALAASGGKGGLNGAPSLPVSPNGSPLEGMEFATALWKGVFREDEHADTEAVLLLVDYVKRTLVSLLQQPREDVYRGWIVWGPCVGETHEDRQSRQRRMLEGEWREALHPDGRVYFYHTATHERQWEAPKEGLYDRRRVALMRYMDEKGLEKAPEELLTGKRPAAAAIQGTDTAAGKKEE
jgi:hypothetical protein